MKVYELRIDWATNDASACNTTLYQQEEDAKKAMKTEILQAMQDYEVFDENGCLNDEDWRLDKGDYFWELWEDGCYSTNHCEITITEKEVL